MDDQLTINDLPVECVEEILKWITDRVDRIYARFVCKLWCALIDQDCSKEFYKISFDRIEFDPFYQHAKTEEPYRRVDFSKICSTFTNSQRKKTSIEFDYVNFQGSEQFWKTVLGKGIISLHFGSNCENIPLTEIVENCSILKTLKIDFDFHRIQELNKLLESCVTDKKTNCSVRFLYLTGQSWGNITELVSLVSHVFLGLQNVFFDITANHMFKFADEWNSLSTTFENLKFKIALSIDKETITYDPLSKVRPRMTTSRIGCEEGFNDTFKHLSRYSCDLNHLNSLSIIAVFVRDNYKVDDIQELINQYPSLESIKLAQSKGEFKPSTKPLSKNNIKVLSLFQLIDGKRFPINDAFMQSFKNLKTFECPGLVFSDFVKLLREFPYLEKLTFLHGIIDTAAVDERISSEKLLELQMPNLFLLQSMVKYDFRNLKTLILLGISNEVGKLPPLSFDIHEDHEHSKFVNFPKLEFLHLNFITAQWNENQDLIAQWMTNILAHFPALTEFIVSSTSDTCDGIRSVSVLEITDDTLKKVLANHRRLKLIGDIMDPRILTMLSPSVFKCRSKYEQFVLEIP